jgi:capsular exopolysaccharide synthesis family protein
MSSEKSTTFEQHVPNQGVSPRELLFRYIPYTPWIGLSLVLSIVFTYVKLRYEPKIYAVSSSLMVKDPSERSSRTDKIEEMLFSSSEKNIYDEIQVIQTSRMASRVVRSLGLEVMYFNKGNFMTTLMRSAASPISLQIMDLADSLKPFEIAVTVLDDARYTLGEKGEELRFGSPFSTEAGRFILQRKPISTAGLMSNEFVVTYAPASKRSSELLSSLSVVPSGESNNIMRLSFETQAPGLGEEIVDEWMAEYEKAGFDEKKRSTQNALDFINDQLDTASKELGVVERNLKVFRERNLLLDPAAQSQGMITAMTDLEREVTTRSVQMRLVDNLIAYIDDNRNPYRQVGTLLTVEEPTVAQQIAEFNKLQVQRATLLPTTPRSNPMMVTLEAAIEKLRQDILQNLRNVRRGYQLAIENLNARSRTANQLMSKVPGQQRELLDITRRQQILEQLYQFLLEKKLETAISSASTISSVKVLEPARSSRFPIRPNRQGAYMFAVLLGLGLPLFITFLREYLNDKVRSRQDVVRSTQAPIIGEIGHSLGMDTLVVSSSSRRFISEQFKIIRTNLQYVLPAKEKMVILVTSSTSGEGKSFVATNMGAVVALSGKKTAILEFDIRKPKIMSGLGLGKRKGVTNYIIGGIPFEDLAVKVPGVDNLDVIPCGPVPPNPSELLLDDRLNQFMNRLKEHYDVIIIDTAPVGLVGDAIVIGNHADVSLYVIRHNYTYRKQLQLMDEIYSTKRLPRLCIVLNDIQGHFGGYGGYYGYGGYGYGNYGYGYGKDYFDKESTGLAWLRTGFLGRLFNRG